MPERSDISYFGAGPALLPTQILEDAADALLNFENTGLGLTEHSHRSAIANKILDTAKTSLKGLLDIPDDYEVLFLQSGGSGQFSATVYNMIGIWVSQRQAKLQAEGLNEEEVLAKLKTAVSEELKMDYLVTGSWSLKASQEAARLAGEEFVNVAIDSRTSNNGKFGDIPDEETWKLTKKSEEGGKGSAFVYYCDNETVDGVEFPAFPASLDNSDTLVVADMSSNILSRHVDVKKFAVIFVSLILPTHWPTD
jgi:phosphoserine aminotransferase